MTPSSSGKLSHTLALTLLGATLILIFIGSRVTTLKAGDTVANWPLPHGSLSENIRGGRFYENFHRLAGVLVGLLALVLVLSDNYISPSATAR